jgi:arylsulfatase A-like enzyme
MRFKTLTLFAALLLTVTACQPALPATPTAMPPAATLSPSPTYTPAASPTEPPTLTPTSAPTPAPHASRVLILSIDGLRPDAILAAPMPNLLNLMQNGAYTLAAQTVFPSVTLIAHASMLTATCPDKHGVTWNDYQPARGYAQGTDLFDLAHAAGLQTVMYVGKEKLRQVTEPASVDIFTYINDRDLVLAETLIANFPPEFGVLFVHFPLVDGMGHEHGWMSWQQLSVASRADEALGNLLAELDARGLRNETLIIVTADHGGHDTTHGSRSLEDMTIPWVVAGPGVQPRALTMPVNVMDTAATAAFALGLPIPPEWDGVPVYEAFGLPVAGLAAPCE